MRIVYRIVADCDPPPSDDYMQLHGDELDDELENAVAGFLLQAGAGFSVSISTSVELD